MPDAQDFINDMASDFMDKVFDSADSFQGAENCATLLPKHLVHGLEQVVGPFTLAKYLKANDWTLTTKMESVSTYGWDKKLPRTIAAKDNMIVKLSHKGFDYNKLIDDTDSSNNNSILKKMRELQYDALIDKIKQEMENQNIDNNNINDQLFKNAKDSIQNQNINNASNNDLANTRTVIDLANSISINDSTSDNSINNNYTKIKQKDIFDLNLNNNSTESSIEDWRDTLVDRNGKLLHNKIDSNNNNNKNTNTNENTTIHFSDFSSASESDDDIEI